MLRYFVTLDTPAVITQTVEVYANNEAEARIAAIAKARGLPKDWTAVVPFTPEDGDVTFSDVTQVD
jgi:hypothetical protein